MNKNATYFAEIERNLDRQFTGSMTLHVASGTVKRIEIQETYTARQGPVDISEDRREGSG